MVNHLFKSSQVKSQVKSQIYNESQPSATEALLHRWLLTVPKICEWDCVNCRAIAVNSPDTCLGNNQNIYERTSLFRFQRQDISPSLIGGTVIRFGGPIRGKLTKVWTCECGIPRNWHPRARTAAHRLADSCCGFWCWRMSSVTVRSPRDRAARTARVRPSASASWHVTNVTTATQSKTQKLKPRFRQQANRHSQ